MRLSPLAILAVTLAAPLLAGCTVNTAPSPPVVVQERVPVQQPPAVVAPPPVVLQRY
jgi:hypothetical protein